MMHRFLSQQANSVPPIQQLQDSELWVLQYFCCCALSKSHRSKLSVLGFRPVGGRTGLFRRLSGQSQAKYCEAHLLKEQGGKELYMEAKQIYDKKMRTGEQHAEAVDG